MQPLVNDDSDSISKQAVVAYFIVLSRNFLKELTEAVCIVVVVLCVLLSSYVYFLYYVCIAVFYF